MTDSVDDPKKMMLLALIIATSLRRDTLAEDNFRDLLIDQIEDVKVNNELVALVLDDFYRNLTFVGVCTESKQDRDYGRFIRQMRGVLGQEELQGRVEDVVIMLERGQFKEAIDRCDMDESTWRPRIDFGSREDVLGCSSRFCPGVAGGSNYAEGFGSAELDKRDISIFRTYLSSLRAEAFRLMGDIVRASGQVSEATFRRQQSAGVSINDLERLNALIVLAKVSEYNQEIDKFFDIERGPNFEQLRGYRSNFTRPLTDPLHKKVAVQSNAQLRELATTRRERLAGYRRMLSESRQAQYIELEILDDDEIERRMPRAFVYQRVDPEQDDFRGQTVAKSSAKGILSEFAQKLVIIGANSQTDYTDVLNEMQEMDRDLIESLQKQVEDHGESTTDSLQVASKLWKLHTEAMQTYEKYFRADIYSRSRRNCNLLRQISLLLDQIKKIRENHKGLSADKIFALEGKLLLSSIICTLKRMQFIYKLDGSEGQDELEARLAAADCEKELPVGRFDTVI